MYLDYRQYCILAHCTYSYRNTEVVIIHIFVPKCWFWPQANTQIYSHQAGTWTTNDESDTLTQPWICLINPPPSLLMSDFTSLLLSVLCFDIILHHPFLFFWFPSSIPIVPSLICFCLLSRSSLTPPTLPLSLLVNHFDWADQYQEVGLHNKAVGCIP